MKIDKSLIKQLEASDKIELTDSCREAMITDLNNIIDYIDVLSELDTSEAFDDASDVENIMREDIILNITDREAVLKSAPQKKDGFYVVPKSVE